MNKRMLVGLLIIAFSAYGNRMPCPSTTFIGAISFPVTTTRNPNLPAYYKGAHIDMHNGTYELKEESCAQEFFLLFTLSNIMAQSTTGDDCNTIRNLVMPAQATYVCYRISHRLNPLFQFNNQKSLTWTIETKKLVTSLNKLVIPDNTIIILANPSYVEKLEQDNWKSANSTYRLPKIVFKETITESAIADMANQALLASLDLNAFHRRPTIIQEIKQQRPSVIVSMVNL